MSLLAACAQGGGVGEDAGPDGRRDGGRRDGGGPTRDGGGPVSPCDDRGYAATCQDATDVGALAVGERFESDEGLIGAVGGAQWLRVSFPPERPDTVDGGVATMVGGGAPAVRFLRNANDAYRIEIRSEACVGAVTCGEGGGPSGMAANITEWSFTDTAQSGEEGAGQFSTRDTPWPETIHIRVYPIADPECGTYQLEIVR